MTLTLEKEEAFELRYPDLSGWVTELVGTYFTCQKAIPDDMEVMHEHIYGNAQSGEPGCSWCRASFRRKQEHRMRFALAS